MSYLEAKALYFTFFAICFAIVIAIFVYEGFKRERLASNVKEIKARKFKEDMMLMIKREHDDKIKARKKKSV